MTNSAAAAALDRIESDETFALRVKDAGGPEASIELLKSEGFDVTRSELRDAALDRYGDQLTTEQLDALAAGVWAADANWGGMAAAAAGTAAVVGAAAAAAV